MEFTSIVVHALFFVLQIVALSLLPLGKRLLVATVKNIPIIAGIATVVNFGIAAALSYYWGYTALVVVEVLSVVAAVVLAGRQDEKHLRGIELLEGLGARRVVAADRFLFAWGKGVIFVTRTESGRDAWVQEYQESGQPAWAITEERAAQLVALDPVFWAGFRNVSRENPND